MIFPFFNFSGFSEDDIRYMDEPISKSSISDTAAAVECDHQNHYDLLVSSTNPSVNTLLQKFRNKKVVTSKQQPSEYIRITFVKTWNRGGGNIFRKYTICNKLQLLLARPRAPTQQIYF